MYVCALVYVYMRVYTYVSGCSGVCLVYVYIYLYVRLRVTAFRIRDDLRWVFGLISFSLLTVLSSVLYVSCIITCDRLLYFISLITCITPCDIGDRTSYLFSWIERLLSFHVLVVFTVGLGLALDTLDYDLIWSTISWTTLYLRLVDIY